jgi:hypothetical protein
MPFTILCPFNDAAIHLTADNSAQGFGSARRLQPTHVVACAFGLFLFAPVATFALELGEASIKSGLGQSLLVEIPYRLAANEQLTASCVGIVPAPQAALPTYSRVTRISVTSTHIEIFDDRHVREPLIGFNVDVHCNTAPHFVRSFQLFVDPPAQAPTTLSNGIRVAAARNRSAIDAAAPVTSTQPDAAPGIRVATAAAAPANGPTASTPIARTARANASARARGQAGGDLVQGQTYRVVRSDTLSGIAARIVGRPTTIGRTADAIFAANPNAFTRGNPDLIEAGRSLTIPIMAPATTAAVTASSAPAPLPAVRAAELPTTASVPAADAAPVPAADAAPVPTSATQPPRAEDAATAVTPNATRPLATAAAAVAEPSAAPQGAATPTVAPEEPSAAPAARASAWLTALLALGVVILLSAPLAFVVRRRKQQQVAARDRGKAQKPRARQPLDPRAGIDVVEARLPRAPADDKPASTRRKPPTDPALPAGLDARSLNIGPTDSVDLDVGVPVVMNERVDWFADRSNAPANDVAAAGDETIEENAATARMPDFDTAATVRQPSAPSKPDLFKRPMDDAEMTLTIVELDMLRQDYEAEHTLTQQGSQALRDAVADLKATKAARDAAAETSTMELPGQSQDETTDSAANTQTARVRVK